MTINVIHGDSREALRDLPDASVDSCVCDPPYALASMVDRFGGANWDTGDTAFDPAFWVEVLRVLKPGAHLVAFGGTRTFHRLVCAIEGSGFEIRDQLAWLFGSGFPKSHNQPGGWGTALKPAHEPICLARKPLIGTVAANMQAHGTGALNIDASRIATDDGLKPVDLMAYLVKLVTPPGGLVLDPFAGSGTTGMACMREGFRAVLIEREADYVEDIKRRIAHVKGEDAPLLAWLSA